MGQVYRVEGGMGEASVRWMVRALGLGTLVFGVVPLVAPRRFAALVGFAVPERPTDEAAFRSVGARDVALGIGILCAAGESEQVERLAPWVLTRMVCDAGDTAALLLTIRRGERNPRLLGLTALAVLATGYGAAVLRMTYKQRQ